MSQEKQKVDQLSEVDHVPTPTHILSKGEIKYVDTKNQLADILTKSSFTRDEWNHLLLNIVTI